MRDATGRVIAWDGHTWRTLYVLLFRPGMLTTEYLRGRRKRYARPSRLFFVAASPARDQHRAVTYHRGRYPLDAHSTRPSEETS